jgi:DNA-binding transcriptional LysR family regulator
MRRVSWQPCRDVGEPCIVTPCVTVWRLVLDADVAATRLLATQCVPTHQLTELEEISHAPGALEFLVQLASTTGHPDVFPERFAQRRSVEAGLGLSLASAHADGGDPRSHLGGATAPRRPVSRPIGVIYRRANELSGPSQVFLALLTAELGAPGGTRA